MIENDIPVRLAKHFAWLFSQDALVIYKGHTELDEE